MSKLLLLTLPNLCSLEESGDFDILPDEEHKQDPWCKNFDRLLHGHGYYVIDLTSVFQVRTSGMSYVVQ